MYVCMYVHGNYGDTTANYTFTSYISAIAFICSFYDHITNERYFTATYKSKMKFNNLMKFTEE